MKLSEIFNKNESMVGSIKCLSHELGEKVITIADNFGMKNPNKAVSKSSKGIKVKKLNKDTYLIGLMMFEPPKYIVWTAPKPLTELNVVLAKIAEKFDIVSYINIVEVKTSTIPYFQLAIAKNIN